MTQKKTAYFQMRVDPELKEALRRFCAENYIDESGAIRMAVAQYPPIKRILDELRTKSTEEHTYVEGEERR